MRYLAVYLCIINIAAFLTYGADKRKAKNHVYRIPEKTLLLLAAVGGAAGSLLGMKFFHHKTQHRKFTIGVPLLLILQIAALVLFCRWFYMTMPLN